MSEINIIKNGPYRITGDFFIKDQNGNPVDCKSTVSLCRCGASTNKPFCDGTHKDTDFSD